MNLQQLYYFQKLAECCNFHRAAEQLYVSQPSLSNAISNLEKELGITLFVREHHQIHLTRNGKLFLNQLNPALSQLDIAVNYAHKLSGGRSGVINLAYIPPISPDFIPNCAASYLSLHPDYNIRFSFNQAPTRYLLKGLQDMTYDVIFCAFRDGYEDIEFIPIINQSLIAIVPIGHPLEEREEISIMELLPYSYINYTPTSGIHASLSEYFKRVGFVPNEKYESSSEESIASLVKNGFGVSAIIHTPSIDNIDVKKIKVVPHFSRIIYMAYRKESEYIPSVHYFINYMASNWSIPNENFSKKP